MSSERMTSPSDPTDYSGRLAAVEAELRQLPESAFGCHLLHWNPALEAVRSPVPSQPDSGGVPFYMPLDRRGGKAKVFFAKVHKARYPSASGVGMAERQFGFTYSKWDYSKASLDPLLKAFHRSAEQAGALVAAAKGRLGSLVSAATLAVENDFHRWVFAVYDAAWGNSPNPRLHADRTPRAFYASTASREAPDAPLGAVRYIPVGEFNPFLERDETIRYDSDHIRSIPWSQVQERLTRESAFAEGVLEVLYHSWQVELPEYFASGLRDIIRASTQTIQLLRQRLGPPVSEQ